MPSLVILATADAALADAWERQIPTGRTAIRIGPHAFPAGTFPGLAAVVVLDAAAEPLLPPALGRSPTIFVGEPRSLPFEQARLAGRARAYLSYEDSTTRLAELLPLVEELAEKQSMVELLADKARKSELPRPVVRPNGYGDAVELWDFFEGAVENLETRDRLIAEFRRASRQILRASHAVFFLRRRAGSARTAARRSSRTTIRWSAFSRTTRWWWTARTGTARRIRSQSWRCGTDWRCGGRACWCRCTTTAG